jgi:hypothetical protein
MIRQLPDQIVITETLLNGGHRPPLQIFQTQLLKLYFLTTLYVDVKEPTVQYVLATKKLNLMPTRITDCPPWQFPSSLPGQN